MFMRFSQSRFLSHFSLERSVKQTAYKGINNNGERDERRLGVPGGSGGVGGGYIGTHETKADLSTSTIFMINKEGKNRFDEREFMGVLASQIENEIEESRGGVMGKASTASNEFYLEYKEGPISGRISVSGSSNAEYYVLTARVEESSQPQQKEQQ